MVSQSRIKDLSDSKWAIMVCLDVENDDWIFVTENTDKCDMWDLRPILFEDINAALEFANGWAIEGKEQYVKVVNYDETI